MKMLFNIDILTVSGGAFRQTRRGRGREDGGRPALSDLSCQRIKIKGEKINLFFLFFLVCYCCSLKLHSCSHDLSDPSIKSLLVNILLYIFY